jgi:hypothetical protein
MIARGKPAPDLFLYAAVRRPATAKALSVYLQQPLLLIAAITAPRLLRAQQKGNSLVGVLDPTSGPHQSTLAAFPRGVG